MFSVCTSWSGWVVSELSANRKLSLAVTWVNSRRSDAATALTRRQFHVFQASPSVS